MTRQAFSRTLTKDGSLAKKGKEGEDRGLLQDISAAVNAAVAAQVSPLVSLRGKSLEQLRNTPPLNLPIMQKNSAKSSRLPKPTFHPRSCRSSTASKIWSSGSAPPWQTSTRPRRRWRRRRPWPPTQSTDRRLFRGQCSPTGRLPGRRSRRPTNICRHCQCSSSSRATAASLWAPRSSLTTAEHRRLPPYNPETPSQPHLAALASLQAQMQQLQEQVFNSGDSGGGGGGRGGGGGSSGGWQQPPHWHG